MNAPHSLRRAFALLALLGLLAADAAAARSLPIVYPSGGQTRQQQAADEAECRSWAQGQTGFDPRAWGPTAPGPVATGQVLGGAATGAALGSVGGAIGGRAGRGAAIGAGVGATAGLLGRGRAAGNARDARRQDAAAFQREAAAFDRAFATCMRGRGYSVG